MLNLLEIIVFAVSLSDQPMPILPSPPQISDFGLSAKMGLDETHIEGAHHGTLSHMAPEVLQEGRQSKASDV